MSDFLDTLYHITPKEQKVSDLIKPYSERIPAVIAKAEKLVAPWVDTHPLNIETFPCEHCDAREKHNSKRGAITATEVALAKALWEEWESEHELPGGRFSSYPPALIAFTEKIEQLS